MTLQQTTTAVPAPQTTAPAPLLNGSAPPPAPLPTGSPEPAKDDQFSSKFAALARKERETQELNRAIRAQKESLEKERQEFEKIRTQYMSPADIEAEFAKDPTGAMKKWAKLDYDGLTQRVLNDNKLTPEELAERTVDARMKTFREEQETAARAAAEEKQNQIIQNFVQECEKTVRDNAKELPLLATADEAGPLVYAVIQAHWDKQEAGQPKKRLTEREACDLIESTYTEKLITAIKGNEKLRGKVEEVFKAPLPTQPGPFTPPGARTLSNGSTPPPPSAMGDEMKQYLRPDGSLDHDKWAKRNAQFLKYKS